MSRRSPRRTVRIAAIAALVLFATLLAAPASAAQWRFETLDGAGPPGDPFGRSTGEVGLHNAAVVWNNQPHVFYRDDTTGDLRHAWWGGTAWFFETLDGNSTAANRVNANVAFTLSVTVWNNQPHVFYFDITNQNLRHAWWGGQAWFFEVLDGAGGANGRTTNDVGITSSVTVWNNRPHVFYKDDDGGNLRHAWWNGSAWFFETLDGNATVNGRVDADVGAASTAVVWGATPHVFYHDSTNGDLRHAWWGGQTWFFETLDGRCSAFPVCANGRTTNDVAGRRITVAIWNNEPHVFYNDETANNLRHAWWNGRAWFFETLDGDATTNGRVNGDVGYEPAVLVWGGQPHVWYYDATNGDSRHAWWGGTRWFFESLDGTCPTSTCADGRTSSQVGWDNAAVVWNRQPHVWYHAPGAFDDLRHAWYG